MASKAQMKRPAIKKSKFVSYDIIPTNDQFGAYQRLFAYFNEKLFQGMLPSIMLNFSRKNKNVGGFFAPERWDNAKIKVHEISLNPEHWKKGDEYLISILVHEMAHLWQEIHGTPSRIGYHNKEWSDKMKEIGLYPSSTGKEDGKETGQKMSHYITAGGLFERALKAIPKKHLLPFKFAEMPKQLLKNKAKTKYVCPGCDAKIWGKAELSVKCLECNKEFDQS